MSNDYLNFSLKLEVNFHLTCENMYINNILSIIYQAFIQHVNLKMLKHANKFNKSFNNVFFEFCFLI